MGLSGAAEPHWPVEAPGAYISDGYEFVSMDHGYPLTWYTPTDILSVGSVAWMRRYGYAGHMSDIAEKWGAEVAERGFTQIPNYLLLLNQFLDRDHRLSPVELLVLFQLAGAWWRKDNMPFPSMGTLAVRCGVSERQIQRSINKLEEIELIKRVKRRSSGIIASNAYDLSPLVNILKEVSKAFPSEFPRRGRKEGVKKVNEILEKNRNQESEETGSPPWGPRETAA